MRDDGFVPGPVAGDAGEVVGVLVGVEKLADVAAARLKAESLVRRGGTESQIPDVGEGAEVPLLDHAGRI